MGNAHFRYLYPQNSDHKHLEKNGVPPGNLAQVPNTQRHKSTSKPKDSKKETKNNLSVADISNQNNEPRKTSLLNLDLTNKQLVQIPEDVFLYTQLQHISLFQNKFHYDGDENNNNNLSQLESNRNVITVPITELVRIQTLKSIDLSFNHLKTIPEAITRLPLLNTLILVGNNISHLPHTVSLLTNLQNLKLGSNELISFPGRVLLMSKLRDLQLSRNRIAKFTFAMDDNDDLEFASSNNSIQQLHLDENFLKELPNNIYLLNNLMTLKLSNNLLEVIPAEIGQLNVLESLQLDQNRLQTVPPELAKLKNLRTLNLSQNKLKSLPREWFPSYMDDDEEGEDIEKKKRLQSTTTIFSSLFEMFLDFNEIDELHPGFFVTFSSLRALNLNGNYLTSLPTSIEKATLMQCLDIGSNQLDSLPDELSSLVKLERFCAFNNQLTTVPNLSALTGLRIVYLSYNPLKKIPQLPSMVEDLHLASCKLDFFPFHWLASPLTNLKFLYLANNQIKNVELGTQNLRRLNLVLVDLQDNIITTLSDDFQSLPPHIEVIIEGNPIWETLKETFLNRNMINSQSEFIERTIIPPVVIFEPSKRFHIGLSELRGKRSSMEDAATIVGNYGGNKNRDFVGIYDGHGGNEIANVVASELHKILLAELTSKEGSTPIPDILRQSFITMNDECKNYLESRKELERKIGSTAVIGLFLEDRFYIANIGDSRAVLSRNGEAIRVSKDHKPLQHDERKRIRDLGGFVMSNGRVNGILAVARSFGDFFLNPYVSAEPFVSDAIPFSSQDEFVVFGCDGVFDVIPDGTAVSVVRKSLLSGYSAEEAARHLRDLAFLNMSCDNISVSVVVMQHPQ